jgi:hypothetical protein
VATQAQIIATTVNAPRRGRMSDQSGVASGDIGFFGHAEQHGHTHAGDDALLDRFDACELERTVG